MYLKSLELVGFKSFADKTRLEFDPGLTCIVGPNGCGKSNIADAVRWVIGEQSARALRGTKMEDVIFTGTDDRKPVGMAEVSITFAGCEGVLQTEYDEVTVSRRVFRDGEGQYFLNKTPCRLRDVQRLFMDTGIGTPSYSIMEQGRIDRVLSARPEERRAVFEEASGITKYKTDRREALRKLEQTEANLLRLADVIREVKRQIGSLQRQAGKARRFKELRSDLRGLDLYLARERLRTLDASLQQTEETLGELAQQISASHECIATEETRGAAVRAERAELEQRIGAAMEAGARARAALDHTRELLETNRRRAQEYASWTERDTREIDHHRRLLEENGRHVATLAQRRDKVAADLARAEAELQAANGRLEERQREADAARTALQRLRDESLEMESLAARTQNRLAEMDAAERGAVLRRERLAAEKAQLARAAAAYARRHEEVRAALERGREKRAAQQAAVAALEQERAALTREAETLSRERAGLAAECAALRAEANLLEKDALAAESAGDGARRVLDPGDPLLRDRAHVLGALASFIETNEDFRPAVEACLDQALDCILVRDGAAAIEILEAVERAGAGAARLLAADADTSGAGPDGGPGEPLLNRVRCSGPARPAIRSLLAGARLVDSLSQAPVPVPAGMTYVTRGGAVAGHGGRYDFHAPIPVNASPLGRRQMVAKARAALAELAERETRLASAAEALAGRQAAGDATLAAARTAHDELALAAARTEGECEIVSREAAEAASRLETVAWELDQITAQQQDSGEERRTLAARQEETRAARETLAGQIRARGEELASIEGGLSGWQHEATEKRVRFAELTQESRHVGAELAAAEGRARELEEAVRGRSAGLDSYRASVARLEEESAAAAIRLRELEENTARAAEEAARLRGERDVRQQAQERCEAGLTAERDRLQQRQDEKAAIDVKRAEDRMRRQNLVERVCGEHDVTLDAIAAATDPEWPEERPALDGVETMIAEIRTKIEAMGPVNLIAIEEYNELEERHAFLCAQEQDLVQAKQQLTDMIRTINRTSTEMFRSTFEQVNVNFQAMFARLFDGGAARLVLVNEEDVLECGIEIIARPPGKRLQNVSLLSGGERTLTAVALLFAIYMIKPSPFCMLDELDAALDEANIGRFVAVLQGFLDQSQFLVITHNRRTIAAARCLYGVTMPEKGVSKIVSMRLAEAAPATPAGV